MHCKDGTIPDTFTVTCSVAQNGTVSASETVVTQNTTVTITVTPAEGYELDTLSVINGETAVTTTPDANDATKYTFTMPAANVTVTATFKAIPKPTLTITALPQTYTYNGLTQGEGDTAYEDPAEIAEKVTVDGLLEGDVLTSIVLNGQGKDAGEYDLVPSNASLGEATSKYDISYVNGTLTIEKADNPAVVLDTVTVTAGGNTIDLSENISNAEGTVSYAISGEANGCTLNGSILTSGSTAGTFKVHVDVAGNNNYKPATGTITVTVTEKKTETLAVTQSSTT